MKILIKITKKILEESALCSNLYGHNCAIALAVREIFPNAWVGNKIINTKTYLDSNNNVRTHINSQDIFLPNHVVDFIKDFDNQRDPEIRKTMKPISFEIDVPNEVIEEIGISQIYKILSESKTLELVNI